MALQLHPDKNLAPGSTEAFKGSFLHKVHSINQYKALVFFAILSAVKSFSFSAGQFPLNSLVITDILTKL